MLEARLSCSDNVRESRQTRASQFVSLGRPGQARWLIPRNAAIVVDALSGWEPHRMTARIGWSVLKSALRWPTASRILPCSTEHFDWLCELDWGALGWEQPSPPCPLIYLGTPGPRRKAVVHLIDARTHRCELIVKVPLAEEAQLAIRHEAHVLLELHKEGFTDAPRLVELNFDEGIASQTFIPGRRSGLRSTREMEGALRRLSLPGESITLQEVAGRLSQHLPAEWLCGDGALVAAALERLDDPTQLPAARIHGDFAPWNIMLNNGSAALLDWEEYQPRGLPLNDAYHFFHMTRYLFGKAPRSIWQELHLQCCPSISTTMRWKLELAYLLQTLAMKLAVHDGRQTAFLLTALRRAMASRP